MSAWDSFPPDYRRAEADAISAALRAGECVSLVGLSGAGKSNLLGYLAHTRSTPGHALVLVDANRLPEPTSAALFRAMADALNENAAEPASHPAGPTEPWVALEAALHRRLTASGGSLAMLFDRFDVLTPLPGPAPFSQLRALRDAHKYALSYVTATRRPLAVESEFAELFTAHTLWLGPLSEADARWNVGRHAARHRVSWDEATSKALRGLSWGYPSLLRAVCEAHAQGAGLTADEMLAHEAVRGVVDEFWADDPSSEAIERSGLAGQPLLHAVRPAAFDTTRLTAKEHLLFSYFRAHPDDVCEKDDLIRAVWPEDKVFEQGVRDDSLAQLIRRLREKIEPEPSNPRHIHTVPGRGYRFTPE